MFHICSCINIFTVQLISYLCIFNMSPIPTCQMRQLSQKPIHLTSVQHQTTALNLQAYRSCNLQAKSKCFEIFNFTETLQGFFWVLHLNDSGMSLFNQRAHSGTVSSYQARLSQTRQRLMIIDGVETPEQR